MQNANRTRGLRIDLDEEENAGAALSQLKACIKVIGVGGLGGNAVRHMIEKGVKGVEFICANTDAQALRAVSGARLIQLGQTGLGAGNKPEQGKQAAEASLKEIEAAIEGADLLFITAGMGGGTGTGAAPVIAELARQKGILTIAVVTKPFGYDGLLRKNNADAGLAALSMHTDASIVILNSELERCLPAEVPHKEAYAYVFDVLRFAVGGIAEVINVPAVVNIDLADIKTAVGNSGMALMGTSLATGPDRAKQAAQAAISCPLLEGAQFSGATGVIVLVAGRANELKLHEVQAAAEVVMQKADPNANFIVGTAYDENLAAGSLYVTVILAGLQEKSEPKTEALSATKTAVAAPGAAEMAKEMTKEVREAGNPREQPEPRDGRELRTPGTRAGGSLRGASLFSQPPRAPVVGHRPPGSYESTVRSGVWKPMHSIGVQDTRSGVGEPVASDDLSTPAYLRVASKG